MALALDETSLMTRKGIILAGGGGTAGTAHHGGEQASDACVRQADDLLPAQP